MYPTTVNVERTYDDHLAVYGEKLLDALYNDHEIAVEEDGDEIFYFNGKCTRWQCQQGFDSDDEPIYPILVLSEDEDGHFWKCPNCGYSYGSFE